jgi:D-psicose/D-tagatose/L-ribulose 3-epimerase
MKIGVSAFAWTGTFTEAHLGLLPGLREHGIEAFEIPMFDPALLPAAHIRHAFQANAVECTVCAILPEGINPISPDPSVRRTSAAHLVRCIQTASACGASLIGGPLYAPIGYLPARRRSADEWSWAIEAFQHLGEHLDRYGIDLALEPVNRSETFFLTTAAEAKAFCEAIGHPRIGLTIDTFHANIEEKNTAYAILSTGDRLKHLHLSENDRGLLGSGYVDFHSILQSARAIGYSGYLMIEGFGYSTQEPLAPGALWASLEVSPGDIALNGASFLRSLLSTL